MSLTSFDLPPPRTWQAFEALCHDLFSVEWDVTDANRIGRNGQAQYGVDIVAKRDAGWIGVQCKWIARISDLTPAGLREIVREAQGFKPALSHLVVATTAPNDEPLQREARLISDEQEKCGLFSVSYVGWDDVCAKLDSHPVVVGRHYAALARFGREAQVRVTDYTSRIESFWRQYLRSTERPFPLVGREAELAALDEWFADDRRAYELLRAPAGRGKSALLAIWAATIGEGVALIYMPISARFRTNLRQVVFWSLLSRLSELHKLPVPLAAEADLEQARGAITDLLTRPLPHGTRLLLVIDGLDEAGDFEVTADLFPSNAPPGLKVLLAGRTMQHRADPLASLVRHPTDLGLLSSATVSAALERSGATATVSENLVRLIEGDPLLLRLYLDALAAGDLDTRKLADAVPGLHGFFANWWDDQLRLWRDLDSAGSNLVETLLCVLACALGPLSRDDLIDPTLLPESPTLLQLDAALSHLGRLTVGAGRTNDLVLSHPRFGEFIRDEWIPSSRRADIERRFVHWGERALENATAKTFPAPSSYLISHLGAHLERVGARQEKIAPLTSRYWADCWYSIDPSLSGFLADVDRRRRAATHQIHAEGISPTPLLALVHCSLTSATVRSIADRLNPSVYVAALRLEIWSVDNVIAHMAKVRLDDLSTTALTEVARAAGPHRSSEILRLALSIGNASKRADALRGILPLLSSLDHARALNELAIFATRSGHWLVLRSPIPQSAVLRIAEKLNDTAGRAYALAALLPSVSQEEAEQIEVTIETLVMSDGEAFLDELHYVGALKNLSIGRRERILAHIFEQFDLDQEYDSDQEKVFALREISHEPEPDLAPLLLKFAASVKDEFDRAEGLSLVAASIPSTIVPTFLEISNRIEHPCARAKSLAALGAHHEGYWNHTALELCKTEFMHPSMRAPIIMNACRRLTDAERLALEPTLMADLNASVDSRAWQEHDPDWLLADFAETFFQSADDNAIRLIQQIATDEVRAIQAAKFAVEGSSAFRAQAMNVLRSVETPQGQLAGWIYLAKITSGEPRAAACAEAVKTALAHGYTGLLVASAIEDGWDLERELGEVVVREALSLDRVSDWHALGDALVSLAEETSKRAAADAFIIMNRIGYELPVNRVARAFAAKFDADNLAKLFASAQRTPSKAFGATLLGDIFSHLPTETQNNALRWIHNLPEETSDEIRDKIRFCAACAKASSPESFNLLTAAERLALTLPTSEQKEARAAIHRELSDEPRRQPRPAANHTYSREGLIAQATGSLEAHLNRADYFDLLESQNLEEAEAATIEVLQAAATVKRETMLSVVAEMASTIRRVGGTEVTDGVVAALRQNVETWG